MVKWFKTLTAFIHLLASIGRDLEQTGYLTSPKHNRERSYTLLDFDQHISDFWLGSCFTPEIFVGKMIHLFYCADFVVESSTLAEVLIL